MRKIFIIAAVLLAGFLIWHFLPNLKQFSKDLPAVAQNIVNSNIIQKIENNAPEILTPPPLRSADNSKISTLDQAGVIAETNFQRQQNGNLPALKENSKLDAAANIKLQDMFTNQYFEHTSPSGKGAADLAKEVGYEYITIGENLALGNFKDNNALLIAWMNSPGHRANILNKKYEEIGVAVGRGMFEGHNTWLAVQEFGKPQSSCPKVDAALKAQINSLQAEINQMQPDLIELKKEIDSSQPKTKQDYDTYNSLVAQYNAMVKIFNNKVDTEKLLGDQYNAQVRAYNACAA